MLDPVAETGVWGPPEDGSDVEEKVGEGVSGKASLANRTCFPGIVEFKEDDRCGYYWVETGALAWDFEGS